VLSPGGPLVDPFPQQLLLIVCKLAACRRRRHHDIRIIGRNPLSQLTLPTFARHNHRVLGSERDRAFIQSQLRLTRLGIWAMTLKAMIGKKGTNLPAEINRRRLGEDRRNTKPYETGNQRKGAKVKLCAVHTGGEGSKMAAWQASCHSSLIAPQKQPTRTDSECADALLLPFLSLRHFDFKLHND
jgi:hypothetical protein